MGGYSNTYYTGSITWVPLTNAGYWSVAYNNLKIGTTTVGGGTRAIADVGSTLIMGPVNVVNTIHTTIGATLYGGGLYEVDCENISSMPDITIILNNNNFVLSPNDYIIQIYGWCFSGFSPFEFYNNEDEPTWILGDVFLRAFYSIFDYGNQSIGFARAVPPFKK